MTLRPLGRTAVLAGAAITAYIAAVRPGIAVGAPPRRRSPRRWPGDELVAEPVTSATHAITIGAPAGAIWPWLVQLGQNRGWRSSGEMAAAMFAPGVPVIVLLRSDVIAFAAVCGLHCALMMAAMLALMLYRRSEYTM
jgi:hypothetical protein